jgi:hypothetical protein
VRRFLVAWLGVTLLASLAVLPLAGFAADQFQANQAAGRGFNAPKQAGDVGSGTTPGIYVALTNAVWAVFGYHSTAVMAAIGALWPLAMLAALLGLGRRARPLTLYVVACALLPAAMLFVIGFLKPFLFEVRYFAGAVPLVIVLLARAATGWLRGTVATALVGVALVGGLAVADADQQLNGSNPRVYDFEGALAQIKREQRRGDVVLYQPSYLRDVVRYYAPGLRSGALEDRIPTRAQAGRVWVIASFQDQRRERDRLRRGLRVLDRDFDVAKTGHRPQIRMWLFTKSRRAHRR